MDRDGGAGHRGKARGTKFAVFGCPRTRTTLTMVTGPLRLPGAGGFAGPDHLQPKGGGGREGRRSVSVLAAVEPSGEFSPRAPVGPSSTSPPSIGVVNFSVVALALGMTPPPKAASALRPRLNGSTALASLASSALRLTRPLSGSEGGRRNVRGSTLATRHTRRQRGTQAVVGARSYVLPAPMQTPETGARGREAGAEAGGGGREQGRGRDGDGDGDRTPAARRTRTRGWAKALAKGPRRKYRLSPRALGGPRNA